MIFSPEGHDGETFAISALQPVLTIGRASSCDVAVDDTRISRVHCEIKYSPSALTVFDHSSNGTFINEKVIGKGNSSPLSVGDVLAVVLAPEKRICWRLTNRSLSTLARTMSSHSWTLQSPHRQVPLPTQADDERILGRAHTGNSSATVSRAHVAFRLASDDSQQPQWRMRVMGRNGVRIFRGSTVATGEFVAQDEERLITPGDRISFDPSLTAAALDTCDCVFRIAEEDDGLREDGDEIVRIDTSATITTDSRHADGDTAGYHALPDGTLQRAETVALKMDAVESKDEEMPDAPVADAVAVEEPLPAEKKAPVARGRKAARTTGAASASAAAAAAADSIDASASAKTGEVEETVEPSSSKRKQPKREIAADTSAAADGSRRSTRQRVTKKPAEEEAEKEEAHDVSSAPVATSGRGRKRGAVATGSDVPGTKVEAKPQGNADGTTAAAASAATTATTTAASKSKKAPTKPAPKRKTATLPAYRSPKPGDFPLLLGSFTVSMYNGWAGFEMKKRGWHEDIRLNGTYHENQLVQFIFDPRVEEYLRFTVKNIEKNEHGNVDVLFEAELLSIPPAEAKIRFKSAPFGIISERILNARGHAAEATVTATGSGPWTRHNPPIDPATHDLFQLLEAARPPPTAPEMPSPPEMTMLLSYQRKALGWMVAKENGDFDALMPPRLHVGFRRLLTPGGFTLFQSKCEPMRFLLECPLVAQSSRGGVLADEMGLGKSVEVIALILANRRPQDEVVDVFPPALARLAVPTVAEDDKVAGAARRSRRNEPKEEEKDVDPEPVPIRATLLVAPQPIIQQWQDEFEMHAPGALRIIRYDGMDMKTSGAAFMDCDVVLTTYEALRKDLRSHSKTVQSPLLHCEWWRIVLDEAQAVCSSTSAVSQMAGAIARVNSWCVSGTPISNRARDLRGLVDFLEVEPYVDFAIWKHAVSDPYEQKTHAGVEAMRTLVQTIMWRHRKEHVQDEITLPPCVNEEHWLPLSAPERSFYDRHHDACRRTVQQAQESGNAADRVLMQQLLQLRQACCHPQVAGGAHVAFGGERLTMQQILERLHADARAKHRAEIREHILANIRLGKARIPDIEATTLLRECRDEAIKIAARTREDAPDEWTRVRAVCVKLELKATQALLNSLRSNLARGLGGSWPEVRELEAKATELDAMLPKEEEILPSTREMRDKTAAATIKSKAKAPKVKEVKSVEALSAAVDRAQHKVHGAAHEVQHLATRLAEFVEAARGGGASAAAAGGSSAAGGGGGGTVVAEQEDGTCPVCLEVIECATVTPCGHVFCKDCIHGLVETATSRGREANCPLCRNVVAQEDLINAMSKEEEAELERAAAGGMDSVEKANVVREFGTKIAALIQLLKDIDAERPGAKTIVFSQWNRLLVLVMDALTAHDIGHVFMSGKQREMAVSTFRRDPACRVLLLNMRTGSGAAGLTLTVANHAVIMEPSLNISIEDQAAARVHRIGQRLPVKIHRLLISDSIETGILRIQQNKRMEASKAAASRDEQEKLQIGDLLKMFNL